MSPILLRGGTLLIHGVDDQVTPQKSDLLIKDNTIAAIGLDLKISTDTNVIDCSDKIISAGFIDTHHHVWQSILKGRHANG
jgi:predicted amidohydrolase